MLSAVCLPAIEKTMPVSSIKEIISDIHAGDIVIMVDDKNRENEGDLIVAAEKVTPETINFMAKYGRGLICLTLTRERCKKLNLPLMVSDTNNRLETNFTLSIDARENITTGISAQDRAQTIRVAVNANAVPTDITRPGHIFPLMAQPGGVLTRAGHTEAGCDLAKLAKLEPASVIVEILNDDGDMARQNDIEIFAQQHGLKIGTIEDLIAYCINQERTIHFIRREKINTAHGEFMMHIYEDTINQTTHLALTCGEIHHNEPLLVRVHVEDTLNDTIGVENKSWPLSDALKRIIAENLGVAVILRLPEKYANLEDQVSVLQKDNKHVGAPVDRWTLGVGGQILNDLGVGRMRLMSSLQRFHGLGGFGLSIEEYVYE